MIDDPIRLAGAFLVDIRTGVKITVEQGDKPYTFEDLHNLMYGTGPLVERLPAGGDE